jgi:hypothetical protein
VGGDDTYTTPNRAGYYIRAKEKDKVGTPLIKAFLNTI